MLAISQTYRAGQAEIQMKEVEAWIALAEGNDEPALALMHEAVVLMNYWARCCLNSTCRRRHWRSVRSHTSLSLIVSEAYMVPAHAAELAGEQERALYLYTQLITLAAMADSERPELVAAKEFVAQR